MRKVFATLVGIAKSIEKWYRRSKRDLFFKSPFHSAKHFTVRQSLRSNDRQCYVSTALIVFLFECSKVNLTLVALTIVHSY